MRAPVFFNTGSAHENSQRSPQSTQAATKQDQVPVSTADMRGNHREHGRPRNEQHHWCPPIGNEEPREEHAHRCQGGSTAQKAHPGGHSVFGGLVELKGCHGQQETAKGVKSRHTTWGKCYAGSVPMPHGAHHPPLWGWPYATTQRIYQYRNYWRPKCSSWQPSCWWPLSCCWQRPAPTSPPLGPLGLTRGGPRYPPPALRLPSGQRTPASRPPACPSVAPLP